MSVHELLSKRAEQGKQIRVGMIGAGRYGAMYLAQSRFIPGIQIVCIADLNPEKAKKKLGWEAKISFEDMIAEMVECDIEETKRDLLCLNSGFKVLNRNE